jgi:hypothetical protein
MPSTRMGMVVGMKSKEKERVQCSTTTLGALTFNYIVFKNVKIFRNYFLQNFTRKIKGKKFESSRIFYFMKKYIYYYYYF